MITRDEAARLPTCLASVRGIVDEIIVVDTGSQDATVSIAKDYGATIHEINWPNDFSQARNQGLARASGRWILVLDADEYLPATSAEEIHRIASGPADHAYGLIQRNALAGGAGHVDVRIVRLFPNCPNVRFERPIHEQINTSLERAGIRIIDTDIVFQHTGYMDARVMPEKMARNRVLIEASLEREPDGDPNLRYFYASLHFDGGDWDRAAEEYAKCASQSDGRRRKLADAARIKQAECLVRLARSSEAVALLAGIPAASGHPLACDLRAKYAADTGNLQEARRWYERLVGFAETAYLPPVALGPLKINALRALAEGWFSCGRKDVAVKLLRLALEVAEGRQSSGVELNAAYIRAIRPG